MARFFGALTIVFTFAVGCLAQNSEGPALSPSASPKATASATAMVPKGSASPVASVPKTSATPQPAPSIKLEELQHQIDQLSSEQQQRLLQGLRSISPSKGSQISSGRIDEIRRSLELLTPEQQRRVLQNLPRWLQLSADEKELLRLQERIRREKREKAEAEALTKSGLRLNDDQRRLFRRRYDEERNKIEEQLAKDAEEKRQKGNQTIIDNLKKEFSTMRPITPTTTSEKRN